MGKKEVKRLEEELLKQEISRRVNELRIKRGLSMDSFADLIGSTSANVSNIENKKSIPGGAILLNMAKSCNVTTDWILTGEEPEHEILKEAAGKQIFFRDQWLISSQIRNGYMSEEEMQIHDAVFSLIESVQELRREDIELLKTIADKFEKK